MECVPFVSTLQCCSIRCRSRRHLPAAPSTALASPSKRLLLFWRGEVRHVFSVHDFLRPACSKGVVVCFSGSDDSSSSSKISSAARIRSEVISPFRSVRMFFYAAFIASASIGALTTLPRLIAAVGNAPNASSVTEVLMGLGIDLAAVIVFALLYRADAKARDLQIARLSREENLATLKVELRNKKTVTLGQLRGVARLVIVAGPVSHLEAACRASEPYFSQLVERGVAVIFFATDGQMPNLKYSSNDTANDKPDGVSIQLEKLWRGSPIYTAEWTRWLMEQKQLANVRAESPVYLSLRLDGRVRGSGTGLPPWGAFVAQLPPMKGMWGGVLDGMDGRI